MEEAIRHPAKMSPHLGIWLRSMSSFLIKYECFQVQICQSSVLQTCVSARIWLSLCVCVCVSNRVALAKTLLMWFLTTRIGWSQLSSGPPPAAEKPEFC